MADQLVGRDEIESLGMEMEEIGRSLGSSFHHHAASFRSTSISDARSLKESDDEVELQWAAIERLPTFERIKTSLFDDQERLNGSKTDDHDDKDQGKRMIDVTRLGVIERRLFIEKLLRELEEDNRRLLHKLKERVDR